MGPASRWQDWTSFALGVWLALSPWFVDYLEEDAATVNAVFCGLLLALAAHFEASCCDDSGEWINLSLGLWLLAAPFALGFAATDMVTANAMAVGLLVAALAASALDLGRDLSRWIARLRAQ
ncbi:MAG: SPW repeat protein [Betaproteobacteria bacterium]